MPYLQSGNSPAWVAGQVVTTVGLRVLIVWVYNNTGRSVFSAIVFPDVANVGEFLYPDCGSGFDPVMTGIVTAVVLAIVVFLWGPPILARFRYSRTGGVGSATG